MISYTRRKSAEWSMIELGLATEWIKARGTRQGNLCQCHHTHAHNQTSQNGPRHG